MDASLLIAQDMLRGAAPTGVGGGAASTTGAATGFLETLQGALAGGESEEASGSSLPRPVMQNMGSLKPWFLEPAEKAGAGAAKAGGTAYAATMAAGTASYLDAASQISDTSPLLSLGALRGGRLGPMAANPGGRLIPYTPPAAGEPQGADSSEAPDLGGPLPAARSTYTGSRFRLPVALGQAQAVGEGVEQFHFPHLVQKDGTTYAYFIDHSQGSENDVGLATSSDGVSFEYQGKVLTKGEPYDDAQASFPAVQIDPDTGQWVMLYEAKAADGDVNSVCLAVSDDGVNWEKKGPIISPNDAGEMSNVDVGTPTLFKEDGVWHVYFHAFADDGRVRIGYASGEDLQNLEVRDGPILDVDARGIESGTVGARSNVVKVGDWYYMAYEVCSADTQFGDAQWGTNLARASAPDGPWQKMAGPLLENDGQGFGMDGPELLLENDRLWLYYRHGANATARVEVTGLDSQHQGMALAHQRPQSAA